MHCGSSRENEGFIFSWGDVVNERIDPASYFPEAGNLIGSNTDMCSDVAGPSSSGSGDLF